MNQTSLRRSLFPLALSVLALAPAACVNQPVPIAAAPSGPIYDVRSYGAAGDGKTIDTAAINRAIEVAAAHGGGTVLLPAGTYASFSIHLKSNVTVQLAAGATLFAAEPPPDASNAYDPPEPNASDQFQDFGHCHWHNSLIWGENLENVAILGPGRIYGFGLSRGLRIARNEPELALRDATPEERKAGVLPPAAPKAPPVVTGPFDYPTPKDTLAAGIGNKAIALKNCRNVLIRDLTITHGGHFGILATGVDNLTIENLMIDTNRDGMDIDSCRDVRISDCTVNSPYDDGICLKADYGLGFKKPCEDVAITNCNVSGFDEGTVVGGTYETLTKAGRTGRIKFGTEATGGFRNVAISNCTFDTCCGLAIEEVDGAALEDVSITNLTMRNIVNSAIYVRLGARNRGPAGTETGSLRRVSISNVVAWNVDPRFSSIIMGVPGHPIEGLKLSNIRITYRGGGSAAEAAIEPPETPTAYPEPSRHGTMPAYGFYVRHVDGIAMDHVQLDTIADDARPPVELEDVSDALFERLDARHAAGTPVFVLSGVNGFEARDCQGVPDVKTEGPIADKKL